MRSLKTNKNSTIKVSWISENDKSYSLTDVMKGKDHGWACGASAGYVAIHREQPDDIHDRTRPIRTTDKVNNLFKSTKHYVSKENGPHACHQLD